jgi:hypothetical protein
MMTEGSLERDAGEKLSRRTERGGLGAPVLIFDFIR